MVGNIYRNIILLVILHTSFYGLSQGVFSTVSVNKSEVYVGEAVELTVSVFTPTWFTKGVDIGNIKVNGAFSVYFRSVSTSKSINGQTYAGVLLIYNLFPFEEEDIVVPSLTFEVESPALGGYKGITRKVQTKEKIISIKPKPIIENSEMWLVTGGLQVQERWMGNLKGIKVGDVLERSITRNATNTVAELIPPIIWDSIPNVSSYLTTPVVTTNKSKTSISATRKEAIKYLFEEEGEVQIPELEFEWWNPYQKKFLKRTLKGQTIVVAPNPNLGILKTIKDSLKTKVEQPPIEENSKNATSYFGLSLREFLTVVILLGILAYFIFQLVRKVWKVQSQKRRAYKNSELYAFRQFLKHSQNTKINTLIHILYQWLDHLDLSEPTLRAFAEKSSNKEVLLEIERMEEILREDGNILFSTSKSLWKRARSNYQKNQTVKRISNVWINP